MFEVNNYLNSLLKNEDTIVLGCSGGPDSMCLLNLLLVFKNKLNIRIIVAHVNHNVRKESDQELLFLKNFCEKNDIFFESMKIEHYGDDNFHNEARTIRYNFFEEMVGKYNANYLFTAHHGDDLIETVLMRIVRGSTLSGYGGFAMEVDRGNYKIIRPLVYVTKDEILDYDKKNKIAYVIDKSNFKTKYTRNRYRKFVLPFLKKEDKNVHRKFLKYSKTLFAYDNYIEKQVKTAINKVYINKSLKIDIYKKFDSLIQDKIIYLILEEFYQDDLILISDVHVNLIKNLIYSNKANSYVYLPNNIKVIKSYDELTISKDTDLTCCYEIEISDYVHLPNNKCIEVILNTDKNDNCYSRLAIMGEEKIKLPLTVRTRRSGDKMLVKGMNKYKKVKDIFIDAKIPISERDIWPVVVDANNNIVWIPGVKKSQFDIPKNKKCDIILWYH